MIILTLRVTGVNDFTCNASEKKVYIGNMMNSQKKWFGTNML